MGAEGGGNGVLLGAATGPAAVAESTNRSGAHAQALPSLKEIHYLNAVLGHVHVSSVGWCLPHF